ncbi:glycosyltransferase family 2 protein [Polaribacter porphyrae]|uniref:Glycosyltransferase 2-like domain-containing protein n=1 Tax=Polaribacter porphyrae TaxID=1137780 RepID=A0A2S7WTW9_9FLAO|nr:glycosyltransferase family 2 protein [Polaribacter porphyrae]PQJ81038.1 hypothetical protein BTO18_15075 [Polaribacter porphyrae]
MNIPLLSIITATFNSELTLEETIESLLNQNYTNFEYILIDGKSNDKTLQIIKKYESIFSQKKIPYYWISENDTGIYNAWNKGLKLASGSWISFLGSDDIYLEGVLKKYANLAIRNRDIDFIHSKVKLMKDNKEIFVVSDRWKWNDFKRQMKIAHVGSFHNKNYFSKYGIFNENYKIAGDYEMLLRAKHNLKTLFFDEFTALMKDGGISNKNVIKAFKEVRKARIYVAAINKRTAFLDFYISIIKYYLSRVKKMISQ